MNLVALLKNTNKLLISNYKKNYFLLIAFMIASNLIQVFSFLSVLPFITYLVDKNASNPLAQIVIANNIVVEDSLIYFLAFFSIAFLVIGSVISIICIFLEKKFGYTFLSETKRRLFKFYLDKDYSFFLRENISDITSTLINDVERLGVNIVLPFLRMVSSVIIIIIFLLTLLFLYPKITLAMLILFPSIYLIIFFLVKEKLKLNSITIFDKYHKSVRNILETFPLIKEIKLYRKEAFYQNLFSNNVISLGNTHASNQIIAEVPKFITETIGFVIIILFCLISMSITENFNTIIPAISMFVIIGYKTLPSIQLIFNCISSIKGNESALSSIHNKASFLFSPLVNNEKKETVFKENCKFESRIKLSNVSFSYNNEETEILKDLNIIINKNTVVGINGPSGSGKSSLVNVLIGLLKADHGKFYIDNTEYSSEDYFKHSFLNKITAYVPQSTFFMDDTIAKNIALGDVSPNKNKISEILKRLGIYDFVNNLPNAEETLIGENAVRLSGGQKQRLAIARALYREPEIIIFDESTSSLDMFNQDLILRVVSDLKKTKTIIFVSHSEQVANYCDHVYSFEKNKNSFIKTK
tara:strand:- start:20983 stop:22734 length:1752 start_codon:yes stop_codon:yes gene_type:complete